MLRTRVRIALAVLVFVITGAVSMTRDGQWFVTEWRGRFETALAAPPPPFPVEAQAGGASSSARLSWHLDELYRLDTLARIGGRALDARTPLPPILDGMRRAGQLRLDDAGGVEVFIETEGDVHAAVPALATLGLRVDRLAAAGSTIQGRLPISSLAAAAAAPGVVAIRQPDYAEFHAGSVTTQGDSILHADQVRAKLGVDGAGVKVGVISDGLYGLATSQGTGDLPPFVDDTTCNVAGADPTASAAGSEGTAMLEIVHDLAPGAQLWFGYFGAGTPSGGTSLDFMAAVNCLAAHVDVVVDDVGFFNNGPYDGTSPVSVNATMALNNPTNSIRAYYTAVGNSAGRHYEEPYVSSGSSITSSSTPADFWSLHGFQATAATTSAGHNVSCPTSSPYSCGNQVRLSPGAVMAVSLQWNDPFGASTNDYDLLLRDETDGKVYIASANRQNGAGTNPTEAFAIANPYSAPISYFDIVIGNYRNTAAQRTFNMFLQCYGCQVMTSGAVTQYLNFDTPSGSVANNGDAGGGVVSLGAQALSTSNIEPFSSRGPTADGRTKPDATAVDGVSVSGAGGFPTVFTGTSAAAPHAAGVAALLLSCNSALRSGPLGVPPTIARDALHTAVVGTGAMLPPETYPPNTYGIGLINALEATGPAQCQGGLTSFVISSLRDVAPFGRDSVYVLDDCAIKEFFRGVETRQVAAFDCATIFPNRITVDTAGDIYLTDSALCGVYKLSGGVLSTVAGPSPGQPQRCGDAGDGGPATAASLNYPMAIAVDSSGKIYVAEYLGCRVRMISGGTISTVAGNGTCGNAGDGGPATGATITPNALRVDDSGNLYIGSLCAVRKVTGGVITTVAGDASVTTYGCPATGDGGPATAASFQTAGIAVDAYGSLYIADGHNCNVREVSGGVIRTVAGIGRPWPGLGCAYNGFHGYAGAALETAIDASDVAVDPAGNLYIGEYRPLDTTTDSLVRVAAPLDRDWDGCRDSREGGLGLSSVDAWDFYSVPVPALFAAPIPGRTFRDSIVGAADAQAVFGYFKKAAKTGTVEYEQDLNGNGIKDGVEYDRSVIVGSPGASGPPNGVISASDAQLAFAQFKKAYKC